MERITYITSLLTFYMKGEISVEKNFLKLKDPNSILGLIPLGAKKENIPVNQISSTQSNFKVKVGKLLLGLILLILSFAVMFSEDGFFGGLILLIIAGNTILNGFEITLEINMTSGKQKVIDFFIFEKRKVTLAEEQLNTMVSNRLEDTNTRQQTDRIVDAIQNNS